MSESLGQYDTNVLSCSENPDIWIGCLTDQILLKHFFCYFLLILGVTFIVTISEAQTSRYKKVTT